jgi:23S rRNA (adenine2030-N6)-methyltransferase
MEAVRSLNDDGETRLYPGSPLLIARALRPQDRYLGCELRPDDYALLVEALTPFAKAKALQADGYASVTRNLDPAVSTLVLIDPPFEAADDYDQIAAAVRAVLARHPQAAIAIWVPLKDLETFDALLRRLEDGGVQDMLVVETRLRPLRDPMKMNGCAMLLLNAPAGLEPDLTTVAEWVAGKLGEAGAAARVWRAKS